MSTCKYKFKDSVFFIIVNKCFMKKIKKNHHLVYTSR